MIRQSTSFLVVAIFLFLAALLIEIWFIGSTSNVILVIVIASTSLALYSTIQKDADKVPPIAYPCGILILIITLFLGIMWDFAQRITSFTHAEIVLVSVLLTVLGGITAFIGGLFSKWEGEGKFSEFSNW